MLIIHVRLITQLYDIALTLVVLQVHVPSLWLLRFLSLVRDSEGRVFVEDIGYGRQGNRRGLGMGGVPHLKQEPTLVDYPRA